MLHRIQSGVVAWSLVLGLAAIASAQTGLVKGKVVDAEGKPVADAAIVIEGEGSGRKLNTKSDRRGEFVQLGLQSGSYRIMATAKAGSGGGQVSVRVGQTAELTIVIGAGGPVADPKMAEMKAAFDAGVAASRANDHDAAIDKFQAALAAVPTCPECYFNIGFAYMQKKDEAQAEANWKKALEQKPDHSETLNSLATLYNNQKRFDEAVAMSAKAASAAPAGNADAIYNQGIGLWNAGKIAEAKVKFEEAVKADPNHADARFQLGMANVNEGKLPEAIAEFEQYLKMAPSGQFAAQAKGLLAQLKPPPA